MPHVCERFISFSAKHSDCASMEIHHLDIEHQGPMPYVGIFGGDYTSFTACLDCGKIQNWKPILDAELKSVILEESLDDEDNGDEDEYR